MTKKKRSAANGLYRDGGRLVIREGARFPDRCAICNKASDGEPVEFTFGREKAHYIEVAAAQAVGRAVGDFITGAKYTGPVRTEIPLCAWHRGRRRRLLGIGVVTTILAVGFLYTQWPIAGPGELGFLQISLWNWIAIAAALVGVVLTLMSLLDAHKLWFKAIKYYDRFVWVAGAGRAFLRELPPLKDHDYDPGADNPDLTADELIRRAGLDDE
jgi:hypothetical protein